MVFNDPKANQVRTLKRAPRQVAVATDLRHASVSGGRTRFIGSNSLVIEGSSSTTGTANISGAQNISGTQTVTGTTNQNGPVNIAGTQTVTGTLNQNGPWNLAGAGGITGAVSLVGNTSMTGSLTVLGGGKILVGPITISPTGTYGARISAGSVLEFLTNVVALSGNLLAAGDVAGNTLGMLAPPTTTSPANVFVGTDGTLRKVTSAAKFKYDPQTMDLPASLLDVPVRDWLDSGAVDRFAETVDAPRPYTKAHQATIDDTQSLKRVPGVIAQEVAAAGGEAFVSRTPDGEIEGVAYDRFALARTAVLAEKLEQAMALIEDLQAQVTSLSAKPATP